MDTLDRKIILELIRDSRIRSKEMAMRVGVTESTISRRLKKIISNGWVSRFTAQINYDKIDLSTLLISFLKLNKKDDDSIKKTERFLISIPGIVEVHKVFGENDYCVKIRSKDNAEGQKVVQVISTFENIRSIESFIASETLLQNGSEKIVESALSPNNDADDKNKE